MFCSALVTQDSIGGSRVATRFHIGSTMKFPNPGYSLKIIVESRSHRKEAGIPLAFSTSPCAKNSSKRRYVQRFIVSNRRVGVERSLAWTIKSRHCCYVLKCSVSSVVSIKLCPLLASLVIYLLFILKSITLTWLIWSAMSVARIMPIILFLKSFISLS